MRHSIATVFSVRYRLVNDELTSLLDTVLAGEVITDRGVTERLVRLLGAAMTMNELHAVDGQGRCAICRRPPRLLSKLGFARSACTVYSTMSEHLTQPSSRDSD